MKRLNFLKLLCRAHVISFCVLLIYGLISSQRALATLSTLKNSFLTCKEPMRVSSDDDLIFKEVVIIGSEKKKNSTLYIIEHDYRYEFVGILDSTSRVVFKAVDRIHRRDSDSVVQDSDKGIVFTYFKYNDKKDVVTLKVSMDSNNHVVGHLTSSKSKMNIEGLNCHFDQPVKMEFLDLANKFPHNGEEALKKFDGLWSLEEVTCSDGQLPRNISSYDMMISQIWKFENGALDVSSTELRNHKERFTEKLNGTFKVDGNRISLLDEKGKPYKYPYTDITIDFRAEKSFEGNKLILSDWHWQAEKIKDSDESRSCDNKDAYVQLTLRKVAH